MYHFFAKNEELKSKKEIKTSILGARLVSVGALSSTSWDLQQHLLGPHLYILIHVINFVQITNLCPCHHPFKE
jgi:hypothetical protein